MEAGSRCAAGCPDANSVILLSQRVGVHKGAHTIVVPAPLAKSQ